MEITKIEVKALEDTGTLVNEVAVNELTELQLALVGGGGGDIVWT